MTNEEYKKKVCKTCKHRYNDRDICCIRMRLNGQPHCINNEKATLGERIKRWFKTQNGTNILR